MNWHKHPVIRQQWVLLLLMGAICVIFVVDLLSSARLMAPFMAVPAVITQSWQNVQAGQADFSDITNFGTMVSYAFLHVDAQHVLNNMLFLWLFAALVVELLGSVWMLVIFFFTAITGSLCHVIFDPDDIVPMVGASGAVMGFEGAYLGLAVRWRLPDPHIFPISRPIPPSNLAILAVVFVGIDWFAIVGHSTANVAFAAHLGGFIGGVFVTSFLAPKPRMAGVR